MADPDQALACNPNRIMVSELLCHATENKKFTSKEALGKLLIGFMTLKKLLLLRLYYMIILVFWVSFPSGRGLLIGQKRLPILMGVLNALMKLDENDTELTIGAVNIKRLAKVGSK